MMKRGRLKAVLAVVFVVGLTVGLYLANHEVSLPIPSAHAAQFHIRETDPTLAIA